MKMGDKGILYVRAEYEGYDEIKEDLPWTINLELRNEDFPDDELAFDMAIKKWLVDNGYAPILVNTKNIMEHLHGAIFKGYVAEFESEII